MSAHGNLPSTGAELHPTAVSAGADAQHQTTRTGKPAKPTAAEMLEKVRSVDTEAWNDTGNQNRLVARWGQDIRYCVERRAPMIWNGSQWLPDDDRRAIQGLAEETLLHAKAQACHIVDVDARRQFWKFIDSSCSRRSRENMIHLAETKVEAISINDFDTDPSILCVENGIIDLRNCEIRPHDRTTMCSKMIPIRYDADAECPEFMRFLNQIMGGGKNATVEEQKRAAELISTLQLLFGCAATGVFEKLVVFFYGPGGDNGK